MSWFEGVRYERTYSLTQIDAQHVLLNVKMVDQGKASHWLCEQAQIGDVFRIRSALWRYAIDCK